MTRARLFLWIAAMVAAGALLPIVAILGFHLAGALWNGLRIGVPWLSQAGVILAGLLGGAIVGLLQWAVLPQASARWIALSVAAGLAVALAYLIYRPLAIVAAPVVAAFLALYQGRLLHRPDVRWIRAQTLAAAWVALAWMLPFPSWAVAAFIVGAGVLSGFGIRAALPG